MKFNTLFKKIRDQKGFTLVELLVVMAILAVLAALAVPKFGQMLTDSKYNANNENVDMIYKAAEMYIASHGAPTDDVAMTDLKNAGFLSTDDIKVPYDTTKAYGCTITGGTGAISITPGKAKKNDATGNWDKTDSYPVVATETPQQPANP